MDAQTLDALAKGLSEAQRTYIAAVGASDEPYRPRHGRTANWALRYKIVDTIVTLKDGRSDFWNSLDADDHFAVGIATIGGQVLTPLGLALRDHLLAKGEG